MSNEYTTPGDIRGGLFKDITTKSGKKYKIKKVLVVDFIQSVMPMVDVVTDSADEKETTEKLLKAGKLADMYKHIKKIAVSGLVSMKLTVEPTDNDDEIWVDDFFAHDEDEATDVVNQIMTHSGYGSLVGVEGQPGGKGFRDGEPVHDLPSSKDVPSKTVTDSPRNDG